MDGIVCLMIHLYYPNATLSLEKFFLRVWIIGKCLDLWHQSVVIMLKNIRMAFDDDVSVFLTGVHCSLYMDFFAISKSGSYLLSMEHTLQLAISAVNNWAHLHLHEQNFSKSKFVALLFHRWWITSPGSADLHLSMFLSFSFNMDPHS